MSSARATETDSERAIRKVNRAFAKFQKKFVELMQGHAAFRLRLEIIGDKGRVSEIQLTPLEIERSSSWDD